MGGDERLRTVNLTLRIGAGRLTCEVTVPEGPASPTALVPFAHALASAIADDAAERSASEGRPVSCAKGCGACCRQLVPIADAEARQIARLVDALPEPRRAAVRARFEDARRRLAEAGLLGRVESASTLGTAEARREIGLEYFRLGIPCPFLEDESCGIHPERPASCREYLVTSPPAACTGTTTTPIEPVRRKARVHYALTGVCAPDTPGRAAWVPLVLAPAWAAANPEPAPTRTGEELLREFLRFVAED